MDILNKMGTKEKVLQKVSLVKLENFEIGDKVKLLDFDDFAIVHKSMDKLNNVEEFYKNEFISINAKRYKKRL